MDVFVSTSDIFWRVLAVFSLTLFGVVARRTGTIREEARQSIADTMMNITLPPLIFVSMTADTTWDQLRAGIISPLIALLLILILMLAAIILGRLIPMTAQRLRTFSVLCAMPNTSFIAFPVILSVLGQEGLAYAVLYDVGITIAFCSIAIFALQGGMGQKESWRSLINPSLVATVCGLIINRTGVSLPELLLAPLRIMGNATVPIAMLLMGYMLGGLKFQSAAISIELGAVCICKLLIYPLLAYLLIKPFDLDPLLRMVIIMQAAMPSMASTPVLVEKYGGDGEFAATAVFVTTLLSVVTIPLVVHLLF